MAKRIVVMAGGTGGHIFPALAVALYLKEQGWQVSWLGVRESMESHIVPQHEIAMDWISAAGIRGKGVFGKVKGVMKMALASFQAFNALRRRKPHVVLGMGGFVSVPGGVMARMLGIPLLIQEQNRIPGSANRLLKRWAAVTIEAFPGSFAESIQAIATGNPLRKTFMDLPKIETSIDISDRALRILVVGGSLGAQFLNEHVPSCLVGLKAEVKHQTGPVMVEQVKEVYQSAQASAEVMAFIEDMVSAYQWADLVICRAGAMTISELTATGAPAILVPLPHAIDDHQTANAKYMSDSGAAVLLPQNEWKEEALINAINQIKANLAEFSHQAKKLARLDATRQVAELCMREAS